MAYNYFVKAYLSFPLKKSSLANLKKAGIIVDVNPLKELPQGGQMARIIQDYDIILVSIFTKHTKEMLDGITTPKIIASMSVGLDHIDKAFFEHPLVKVVNIKTANAISVAEHIFALILALSKRVLESNTLVIKGKGHRNNVQDRPKDISGKTIGLIGAGSITQEVIRFARAFNMKILCYTKNPGKHKDLKVQFTTLEKLLAESDIVNVSVPLNDETRFLISKDQIALLKPSAIFINTSRTDIVDTKALIEHADKYSTFYVGLDIDVNEHKELFMKCRSNVIVTPHMAGISKEALDRMEDELIQKIVGTIKK